ncbi:MAG: Hsp20/alpha crystallin family protein [Candidatus Thermoplasmatota archaeon]
MGKKNKKLNIKTKPEEQALTTKTATEMWNPFDVIENINRFFWDDPWMPLWWRRWQNIEPWNQTMMHANAKITPVDLVDHGDHYLIHAEMPGIAKKDLDVHLTPTKISICGKTKLEFDEENKGFLRRERRYSTLCRNLQFPEEVNPEEADATLSEGILTVKVPKKTPAPQGKKVPIK